MPDRYPDELSDLSLEDLYERLARTGLVHRVLELAREEEFGPGTSAWYGDITSQTTTSPDEFVEARVVTRQPCRLAGLRALRTVLQVFAPDADLELLADDADDAHARHTIALIRGPTRQVLAAERTLLNLLSRLCGIATRTRAFVDAIDPASSAGVYHTRKTTPGLRMLEVYAVRCGGGRLHRLGLHDAVLIKDNHLARAPADLAEALTRVLSTLEGSHLASRVRFVQVEADTLEQFAEYLRVPAGLIDLVLLDNMTTGQLEQAVRMRNEAGSGVLLEASGGVTLETVGPISRTGVERISVGSLTHGAVSVDIGLDIGHDAPIDEDAV